MNELIMCEHCADADGISCFPVYGIGPHDHVGTEIISSTVPLSSESWPDNYREDPDCPGMGVWWCPKCGYGKPHGN